MSDSVKAFLSLNNLKKVNQDLKLYIDQNSWEEGKLILSWEGFVENQNIGYGRNGASQLVDLQKILHECEAIDLVRPYNSKSSFMEIFVKSKAHAGQGCKETFTRLRIKDKKGDIHSMDDLTVESLTSKFGRIIVTDCETSSGFSGSNVVQLFPQTFDMTETIYEDIIDTLKFSSIENFAKKIELRGYTLVDVFEYTHKFSFSPQSVKVLKNKITFAYMTNSTYNSLPIVITVEKVKQFKEISLAELGVEKAGYYSHHDKMTILPEQKEEVLKFNQKFMSLIK